MIPFKYIVNVVIFILPPCLLFAQYEPGAYHSTTKVNFVRTWKPLRPITSAATVLSNTDIAEVNQSTQYLDGIGRPFQNVDMKASPSQKDLVYAKEYDIYGRDAYRFIPFASSGSNGKFKLDPYQQQELFHETLLSGQFLLPD